MSSWMYDPHYGGTKISEDVKSLVRKQVTDYALKHFKGRFVRLGFRFKNQFCYIDAYKEPEATYGHEERLGISKDEYLERRRNTPIHLCRLRYFGQMDSWSMAFYTYSNERYEPCCFQTGKMTGSPEEAFQSASIYLN